MHLVGLSRVRVEFVIDRVSYIVLRGRRCNIIVLNMHAVSADKSADSKFILLGFRAGFRSFSQVPSDNSIR